MLGGNQKTEIANPRGFAARLSKIPVQSDRAKLAEIYSLPVMQQVKAMQELGQDELNALDQVEALCNQEIARLLMHYKPVTVSSLLTRYNNILDEMGFSNHPYLMYFHMPRELQREIKTVYTRKVTEENRNLRAFSNPDGYIATARELMTSESSYMNIAIGLCAVTGRRPGEILATARFEKVSVDRVIFTGQLKTKDSEQSRDGYEIPVLCNSLEIVTALARLREKRDFSGVTANPGMTLNQTINRANGKQQSDTARRFFSQYFEGHVVAYNLRAAYALIAADRYKPETVTQRAFFAEILGHSEDDTGTAASYEDFYLKK